MKRITRREFHRVAAAGAITGAAAVAAPLTQATAPLLEPQTQTAEPKPTKLLLTAEQEKKVQEAIAKRDEDVAALRSRTLPYALEPAFVYHARAAARRPAGRG